MTGPDQSASANQRRRFLAHLTVAIAGVGAAIAGFPLVAMVLSPVRRERPELWRTVGRVEDFPIGRTIKVIYRDHEAQPWAGFVAESAAWVRRSAGNDFVAFSAYCTHVGCPVRWEEDAELFFCPCHGGAFTRDGAVAAGPPPRPLPIHPIRIREGRVELQPIPIRARS
jgi:menaquinol-cytochrome c reductase iron-sulfur subunit